MITEYIVEDAEQERLDVFIVKQFGVSRTMATKLCNDGKVTVRSKAITKASTTVRLGDAVTVDYTPSNPQDIPRITLPVLYEDDDCVVINKPIGLLSHSKGEFNPEPTVATWLQHHLNRPQELLNDQGREGIVHRLDRATSGVMICAKTPEALDWLQKQFADRKAKKTYLAIVAGTLTPREAIIDMPIERNPKKPQTFRVGAGGKPSQTQYRVLQTSDKYSLVELRPRTGRTHQLRVHLAQQEHPIIGDTFYDGLPAERLFLHAATLELTLPNHIKAVFEAPLPDAFNTFLARS